jgi:hypothetical protein
MRLMQKTYQFPVQIDSALKASKFPRIYGYGTFSDSAKAGDVLSSYIDKPYIYRRKVQVSRHPNSLFFGHTSHS